MGPIPWGGRGRDGLLGTMRQKAFNRNDLERDKKHSSSCYSSSCMVTCFYALTLHLYLSTHLHTLASLDKAFAVAFDNLFLASLYACPLHLQRPFKQNYQDTSGNHIR